MIWLEDPWGILSHDTPEWYFIQHTIGSNAVEYTTFHHYQAELDKPDTTDEYMEYFRVPAWLELMAP